MGVNKRVIRARALFAAGSVAASILLLAACAATIGGRASLPAQAQYVAMGSSYAAGPGVTSSADIPPNRCARSVDNYAHQLARKRDLRLVDVSCSGATSANLSEPWGDIPAQIDALTPDTKLVTVTIGGNDVGYIGGLTGESCMFITPGEQGSGVGSKCPPVTAPTEKSWETLETRMNDFAREVRLRAPSARLVFVDYPTVLPERGICAATPLSIDAADRARATAKRLSELTAQVARRAGAETYRASNLSRGHDACAQDAWINGYRQADGTRRQVPYHPNLEGMTALANALDQSLGR